MSQIKSSKVIAPPKQSIFVRSAIFISIAVGACLIFFMLTNFEYLTKHVSYFLHKPAPIETTTTEAVERMESNRLVIKRLSIDAPVLYVKDANEAAFQEALSSGVVHFPKTAKPGELGNVYIFGHSSDYSWTKGNYKTVFALLTQAAIGDEITLSDESGKPYTYIVTETKIVSPKDLSVLAQDQGKKMLSLQTSYPLGTALKRFVVIAELKE